MKKYIYLLSKLNKNFIKVAAIPKFPICVGYDSEDGNKSCPNGEVDIYGKEGDMYRCFGCEMKQKEFEKLKQTTREEPIDFHPAYLEIFGSV